MNPAAWIADGEKYALVGLDVKIEGQIPTGQIAPRLWVLADPAFHVPAHWREWLGTIRADEVEGSNLFLLSKLMSSTPGVLDGENQKLQKNVWDFYVGLLLASTIAPAHKPAMLTGARWDGEEDIRRQQDFQPPIPWFF